MAQVLNKPSVKSAVKYKINQFLVKYRLLTSPIRTVPDFIIIGAQRCGTSSLYMNLVQHRCIAPALTKEIHFFDTNFNTGIDWYRSHFLSYVYKCAKQVYDHTCITGEASPYYIFHPHAPKRIAKLLPHVKLIALLRNPVDRAYSHYHHEVRKGFETLSFEAAIDREVERLAGETTKMQEDEGYNSFNHRHYSYLSRGMYVDQLDTWAQFFSKEQMLLLKSEDFYEDPPSVLSTVLAFLGLPSQQLSSYRRSNAYPYSKMEPAVRKRLIEYFEPHNQALYTYLGVNLGWDT